MCKTMTYHSKIEKKQFDKMINIDTGYKIPISDFKSGQIEINNDFSVLSKSVHEALIEQQNKAFKDYLNKIGYVPHTIKIENRPPKIEELPNGNLCLSRDLRIKFDKKEEEQKEMKNKYKLLLDETKKTLHGNTVYRIEALKDFYNVRKGQKGGYVQGYWNLSQTGNCWIHDEAIVWQDAVVSDDATIRDNARVFGNAIVRGDTEVSDTANVFEHAVIDDCAVVSYGSTVKGNAVICEDAYIQDQSIIRGNAKVSGDARARGNSEIFGNAVVKGNSFIYNSLVSDFSIVDDADIQHSKIYDNAVILGRLKVVNAEITKDAVIKSEKDYLTMKNNWTSGRTFTYTHSNKTYVVGCFTGTGDELIKKAYEDGKGSGKFYENAVKYVESVYKLHEELGNLEKENENNNSCFPIF